MSETELDAAVTDLLARGAGAWPDLAPDAGRMRALARARLAASAGDPAAAAALRAEDLYLALACLAGDERAHAGFDRLLSDTAGAALGRMGASATERAEVIQEVRARLLVAPPAPGDGAPPPEPRLAEYAGRGDLRGFVRAVAVRTFLNARRGTRREVLPDDQAVLDRMAEGSADPDLALMRARYRGDFARAFGAAVDRLPERERALLRYTYLDGLGLDELAAVYQVSRATAHRWLVKARDGLAAAVEAQLRAELRLSPAEFHSIRRLIQSEVELSLRRVLAGPAAG